MLKQAVPYYPVFMRSAHRIGHLLIEVIIRSRKERRENYIAKSRKAGQKFFEVLCENLCGLCVNCICYLMEAASSNDYGVKHYGK